MWQTEGKLEALKEETEEEYKLKTRRGNVWSCRWIDGGLTVD
jgi:hypothetical protein